MITFAIVALVVGMFMLLRWGYLKHQNKKAEEEGKGFLIIAGTLLAMWFFPGMALLILGAVILLFLLT